MSEKLEIRAMVCPRGHHIPFETHYAAREPSDLKNQDGELTFEWGLWCYGCDRAYGLSKLKELQITSS